jgi:hypothetical protein
MMSGQRWAASARSGACTKSRFKPGGVFGAFLSFRRENPSVMPPARRLLQNDHQQGVMYASKSKYRSSLV